MGEKGVGAEAAEREGAMEAGNVLRDDAAPEGVVEALSPKHSAERGPQPNTATPSGSLGPPSRHRHPHIPPSIRTSLIAVPVNTPSSQKSHAYLERYSAYQRDPRRLDKRKGRI